MPFREKIAWLSLASIALTFGAYFATLQYFHTLDAPLKPISIGLLFATIILLTIVTTVGATAIAIANPAEANAPADERDRSVAMRACAHSYFVLLILVMAAAATAHMGFSIFGVLNWVLAAIVLAELLRHSLLILGYRRG